MSDTENLGKLILPQNMRIQAGLMNNINNRFMLSHNLNKMSDDERKSIIESLKTRTSFCEFPSKFAENKDFITIYNAIVNECKSNSRTEMFVFIGPSLHWVYDQALNEEKHHIVFRNSILKFIKTEISEIPNGVCLNFAIIAYRRYGSLLPLTTFKF